MEDRNTEFILRFLEDKRSYAYWDGQTIKAELSDIIAVLKELGYRKPGELLSPEEIRQVYLSLPE